MPAMFRTLLVTGIAVAVLGVGSSSAWAVTVQNNGVPCDDPLGGGPAGSGSPFTGGCDISLHASNVTVIAGGQTLDCQMDMIDALGQRRRRPRHQQRRHIRGLKLQMRADGAVPGSGAAVAGQHRRNPGRVYGDDRLVRGLVPQDVLRANDGRMAQRIRQHSTADRVRERARWSVRMDDRRDLDISPPTLSIS
jgi:hypothetical protein